MFAPDCAPEEIQEIAARLRKKAGLPGQVTGEVAGSPAVLPCPGTARC